MRLINHSNLSDERVLELFKKQHRGSFGNIEKVVATKIITGIEISVYYFCGYVANCVFFEGEY